MKVVLFCGGLGMRLRDYSQNVPKPLANIGYRPILWHLMNYYAYYGHKDFVLCLGYQADQIKNYFLNYKETLSNDFVLSKGGREITLLDRDIEDWTISFVDTGLQASIGERLRAVRGHLEGEEMFLANYSDGLTDLPLDRYIESFLATDKVACLLSVRPHAVFHLIRSNEEDLATGVLTAEQANLRVNGGFFVFRREIFDYLREGEDLVGPPLQRLIDAKQLVAYPYDGFWQCMDTFKDKQALEDLAAHDDAPWQVWKR